MTTMTALDRCRLHYCAGRGDGMSVLELLTDGGANVNERDYDKRTALHTAAANGHLNVLEMLLTRGADIKAEDRWGKTALDDATQNHHPDAINFLVTRGAANKGFAMMKQVSFRQVDPASTLMMLLLAAGEGNTSEVKRLMDDNLVSVEDHDDDKRTAAHLAASEGQLEVLKYLVSKKAPLNVKDRMGNRPLNDAMRSQKQACADFLIQNGGIKSGSAQENDNNPSSPNGTTTGSNHPKVFNLKHASKEALQELHSRGIREHWSWDVEDFVLDDQAFARGAGGEIFKAKFRGLEVVAKTLSKLEATSQGFTDLANEITLMSSIRHPNIVTFYGACFQLSPPVMIIEYCAGGNLESRIIRANAQDNRARLTDAQKLKYAHQIALAMTFLHRFHIPIIHRDLKPSNILLTADDNVKITDFGLAKFTPQASDGNGGGGYKMTGETGSYRFMAPEVFEHKPYDQSVDVYAYAMIVYWLFSGVRPFVNLREGVDAVKAATEKKRPPVSLIKELKMQAIVEQAWSHDPKLRPSFAQICMECDDMKRGGMGSRRPSMGFSLTTKKSSAKSAGSTTDDKTPTEKSISPLSGEREPSLGAAPADPNAIKLPRKRSVFGVFF